MKHVFWSTIIFTCLLLFSCEKDDPSDSGTDYRLKMELKYENESPTSKVLYTYKNNKVDSVYNYSGNFGIWNLGNLSAYEYTSAENVSVQRKDLIGNMVTNENLFNYVFQNNKIIEWTVNNNNKYLTYDGDLLVEVCDTPSLVQLEYDGNQVTKISHSMYWTSTDGFVKDMEYDLIYSGTQIEILIYNVNNEDITLKQRIIKHLQGENVVMEESYGYYSESDTTKTTKYIDYDNKGNVVKITWEDEQFSSETDYLFDKNNNHTETIFSNSNGINSHTYYFYESGVGNLNMFEFPKIKYVDFYVRDFNFY